MCICARVSLQPALLQHACSVVRVLQALTPTRCPLKVDGCTTCHPDQHAGGCGSTGKHHQPGSRHPTTCRLQDLILIPALPLTSALTLASVVDRRLFVFSQLGAPLPPCRFLQLEQDVLSRHLAWPRAPAMRYQRQELERTGDRWRAICRVPRALRPVRPLRCKSVCHCITPPGSLLPHPGPKPRDLAMTAPFPSTSSGVTRGGILCSERRPDRHSRRAMGHSLKCSLHKYFT